MALLEINHKPTRRELRQFAGLWLPAMLAVIGGMAWRRDLSGLAMSVWIGGAAVCVFGWWLPAFMRWIWLVLIYAAFPIGWVVSHVLLAVIYFMILTPIGLAGRLCGRDRLKLRWNRSAATYWVSHTTPAAERYFRQF